MSAPDSRFVRACKSLPVDATPVWFMRQAGRYMPEYRAVRQRHSLIEICKDPELAAEVTITAAERLGVDAAIIFADLLLPLEVMGLDFRFAAGEGPVIEKPLRGPKDIARLRADRAGELGYVAESVRRVVGMVVSARRLGGDIKFCRLSSKVHHALQITGLLKVFEVFDSEDEAVRAFPGSVKASA